MKTAIGNAVLELQRSIFVQLAELDKTEPGDVDQIVLAMVSHLRAWKPVSIAPLGTLPAPEAEIRDPRG